MRLNLTVAAAFAFGLVAVNQVSAETVKPEKCHLDHFEDGIMAIVHFGLNTFVDKEWGYGDTHPTVFNPRDLDANQWMVAMKAGGVRRVVLVTKHHDGFNLWPSKWNSDYTVANSPWRGGKGDLVRDVRDASRRAGLRFGVYLSPWDRHQANYGKPGYVTYYHRQFDELFANYGPLSEIWLDGANGGDGWYGGAKETRKLAVPAWDYYRMPAVLRKMCAKYPEAIAFGGSGVHSAVWVGNERGFAPETTWYRTSRGFWETPECDFPLRRGWFWHPDEEPKSLYRLVEIYFASVGRGCVMNIGVAPNRKGLVGEDDVKRLAEFGSYVRKFNFTDLADEAKVTQDGATVELQLAAPAEANCLDLMEDFADGQKISAWSAEAKVGGAWQKVASGTTVGYRRLARFKAAKVEAVRVMIDASAAPGARLAKVALRWAAPVEKPKDEPPLEDKAK